MSWPSLRMGQEATELRDGREVGGDVEGLPTRPVYWSARSMPTSYRSERSVLLAMISSSEKARLSG